MAKKTSNKNIFDITQYFLLHDNVLIEALEREEVSAGVLSPAQYEDKPEFGRVVSVGLDVSLMEATIEGQPIRVGDYVVFNKYSTTKFRTEGKDYYIVRLEDVVGFIEA